MAGRTCRWVGAWLPGAVVVALGAGLLGTWALGDPVYAPLGPNGPVDGLRGPGLPPLDLPCEGHVLEADPQLRDPHFAGARVLMCRMDPDGALGLVLGKASAAHARSVWLDAPVSWGRASLGGPVAPGQGVLVYKTDAGLRFTTLALRVPFPGTGWLGAPRAAAEDVLWVGVGYAGWVAGQLEDEVEAGAWVLTDLDGAALLARTRAP